MAEDRGGSSRQAGDSSNSAPVADPSDRDLSEAEAAAMAHAAWLAFTAAGRTSPNPPVAAVVLDAEGRRLGEGVTQPPGGPHAEVMALRAVGAAARGATLVVTLEPCSHTGRTPACTQAVIDSGIARVVFAVADPTPEAAGGAEVLRDAGVDVRSGVDAATVADGAIRPWLHALRTGRPFVTWKFAGTLDGRSAAADGTSRWISSPASRADAHRLRDLVDAIVVGSGTVLQDDPQLTVRGLDGRDEDALADRQPLRVLIDRRHRVPPTLRIFDSAADTLRLDTAVPRFAMKALFDRGVRHVLLEGGPTLAGAFLEAGLIDEVVAYVAPKLLGAGAAVLRDAGIATIAQAVTLEVQSVDRLGPDLKIVGRPGVASLQEG